MFDREHNQAVLGVNVELVANAVAMVFNRVVADEELLGNLSAGLTLGDAFQHAQFRSRQVFDAG